MAASDNLPLPPASFEFLVESILIQAQVQLGLLQFESEEEQEPNLPAARHSIDLLAMLQEKTRGNLSLEESRLLDNALTELRFRYVQIADEDKVDASHVKATVENADTAPDAPRIIMPDGGKGTKTT